MTLLKFTINNEPIYINPGMILSLSPREDGTEIITMNPNEFYHVDQDIETIIQHLKAYSITKQIINITDGKES
jgi:hypothetical protein